MSGISSEPYVLGNRNIVLPYLFRTLDSSFVLIVGFKGFAPTSSNNLLYDSAPRPIPQCPKHVIMTGAGGRGAESLDNSPNHTLDQSLKGSYQLIVITHYKKNLTLILLTWTSC